VARPRSTDQDREIWLIDDTDERLHVYGHEVIHLGAEVLLHRDGQEAGPRPRAVKVSKRWIAVQVGLIELAVRDAAMRGYTRNLHIQVSRK
jgi:hypothetical protein